MYLFYLKSTSYLKSSSFHVDFLEVYAFSPTSPLHGRRNEVSTKSDRHDPFTLALQKRLQVGGGWEEQTYG